MNRPLQAASAAILLGLALATPLHAATLNAAGGYNAVILGDLATSGGDTEGRLAVAGTMSVDGSYSVGGRSSPDCVVVFPPASSQPQSNGTRTDLVVGGDLTNTGGTTVAWDQPAGNVVIGGTLDPTVDITSSGAGNTVTDNVGNVSAVFDFLTAGATLQQDSINLAALSVPASQLGTVTTDEDWLLALTGTDTTLNVFNLTAAQWASAGYGKSRVIDVPEGAMVLINVAGTAINPLSGTMSFGTSGCVYTLTCADPTDYAPNVLVNYYESTSIYMTGFEHQGSMLAPLATLTVEGGAIDGQSILASVTTSNGFEFHFRGNGADFSALAGETSTVPLPASLPLLAAGLTGLGMVRTVRRRRR